MSQTSNPSTQNSSSDTPSLFTAKDMAKVVSLAHLDLPALEAAQYLGQITNIIALANLVRRAPVDGLEPLYHPQDMVQALRVDKAHTTEGFRDKLLANAPSHDEANFLVPKVIEE